MESSSALFEARLLPQFAAALSAQGQRRLRLGLDRSDLTSYVSDTGGRPRAAALFSTLAYSGARQTTFKEE
jgi:hypothetical protein